MEKCQAKRVAARRAGSAYAYDLPGMLQLALQSKWMPAVEAPEAKARRRSPSPRRLPQVPQAMPTELLKATELVMDWSAMELRQVERQPGGNDVGMLAWRITMKTPERLG